MKTPISLRPALGAVVLTMTLSPLCAEEHEGAAPQPPPYRFVHWDRVEPERVPEFEAAMKTWVQAFTESGMDSSYFWFTAEGPQFTYFSVNPVTDFAQLDREKERFQQIQEALGEEKVAELMAITGSVHHHWNEFAEHLPELSYAPAQPASSTLGFVHLAEHWVRPGMEEPFKELVARVVEAYRKAEAPLGFDAYQVRFGDASFVFVSEAESAAQYYAAPHTREVLTKALGAEAAGEILAAWRECVTNWDGTDFTARLDLSYLPAPPPAGESDDEEAGE